MNEQRYKSLMVPRGYFLQHFRLVFITHRDDLAFSSDERPDQIDHRLESGHHIGRFDQFPTTQREIT